MLGEPTTGATKLRNERPRTPAVAPVPARLYDAHVLTLATFTTLALFALVVSQPLFYLVALGSVSGKLSAPAYVELRQRINAVMNVRLVPLYGATLVSALLLAWVAFAREERVLGAAALIAVAGLVADAALAVRRNVPINTRMDAWSPTDVPADWETHRARWTAAFATRQIVLTVAYAALLAGVVASL
jgi:hypothetical protein